MAGIQYNKMMYNQAVSNAESSKILMDETIDSAGAVLSTTIPTGFSATDELNSEIKDINQVCETGTTFIDVFDNWNQVLAVMEESGEIDGVSWGSYVKFDDSLLIYVDGNPYPIDQYVMGVLDGEHEAMRAYSAYYHGEMSYTQMMEFMKTFAIMARSYGLAQTIYSEYNGGIHKIDHVIQNGSTKQCFNTRLFVDEGRYADWGGVASAAAQASIETTGMVLAKDGEAISMYYTSTRTDKLFELAKQGLNYKEMIDILYAEEIASGAKLSYVDYKTEKIIGEVPTSEMTSSLASVNLNGNAVVNVPFKGGNRSDATVYTGSTGDSAAKVASLMNTYGPRSSNYSAHSGSSSGNVGVTTGNISTTVTEGSSSNASSTSNIILIESELPTLKFKSSVPATVFGNRVTIVDDTSKSVEYIINDINPNDYNSFTESLKDQGYVLSSNGDMWRNADTIVKLVYDPVDNSMKLKIYNINEI